MNVVMYNDKKEYSKWRGKIWISSVNEKIEHNEIKKENFEFG